MYLLLCRLAIKNLAAALKFCLKKGKTDFRPGVTATWNGKKIIHYLRSCIQVVKKNPCKYKPV